jgi:hypothetical protein
MGEKSAFMFPEMKNIDIRTILDYAVTIGDPIML